MVITPKFSVLSMVLGQSTDGLLDFRFLALFDEEDTAEEFPTALTCRGEYVTLLRLYDDVDTPVEEWSKFRQDIRRTLR